MIHNINYQGTTSPLLMTVNNVGPKLTVVVVVRLVCVRSVRAVVTRCRHPATVTRYNDAWVSGSLDGVSKEKSRRT